MNKFLLTILAIILISANAFAANILPETVTPKNNDSYGVFQVGHSIVVYSEPDATSRIKQKIVWTKDSIVPANLQLNEVLYTYIEKNDLALMQVTDIEDEWIEVIYNNSTGTRGWVQMDDALKFDTWYNFYNKYGRKYGLSILSGAPEMVYNLYGTPEDTSKAISTINKPELITLNVIRGNWMLVTVIDMDRIPKTGYIRWRSDDGIKYLFPKFAN